MTKANVPRVEIEQTGRWSWNARIIDGGMRHDPYVCFTEAGAVRKGRRILQKHLVKKERAAKKFNLYPPEGYVPPPNESHGPPPQGPSGISRPGDTRT